MDTKLIGGHKRRESMDKKFDSLPKEYFAQKFNNPKFPQMEPSTLRMWFMCFPIFYLVNIFVGLKSDYAVMRYAAWFVLLTAIILLIPKLVFGRKMIKKHPVGFVRCCILSFGELKLNLLSILTMVAAYVMVDNFFDRDHNEIVNIVYICAGAMILLDIAVNLLFWHIMKKRIIAGAYKEGGNGFFGDMKHKDLIWSIIVKLSAIGMSASLAVIALGRFFDLNLEAAQVPALITIIVLLMLWLICLIAFCDALTLGRIHYIKKFGLEENCFR